MSADSRTRTTTLNAGKAARWLTLGFSVGPDGRPVNFEGCPECRLGPFRDDCGQCGGLGVVPSRSHVGPGTYHVLSARDDPRADRCWCRPDWNASERILRHRDDVAPPAAVVALVEGAR